MNRRLALLLLVAVGATVGCSHMGESTAPKPDPNMFLPKKDGAGGPPESHPTSNP